LYVVQLFAAVGAVAVKVIDTVWPGARLQVPKMMLVWPAVGLTVAVRVPPVALVRLA
jgi:hypothetical protein